MGRIPENIVSEVMERADMLQIVGEYVRLKKAGRHYKGLCPFHNEKTPSFTVSPDKGFFKCFGCGAGGTIYSFLMQAEGWNFPEAVRHVAARVGIDVPEQSHEDADKARKKRQAKEHYHHVMGLAKEWFEQQLWQGTNQVPRDYLISRGVDEEAARVFGLGYAPDGWQGLINYMSGRRINASTLERAGLAIPGKRGHYDRFRDRVIFPIVDIWGKVVAFGGRRLKDDDDAKAGAKYINSPETAFYTKGDELYGLAATRRAIRAEGAAMLVEGNFDVVTLYARGVQNAVAPMGTALTERQVRKLARYTKSVYVAFDGDNAGQKATRKALPSLMAQGFDARVVSMPPGDDPDSLIQREGREALTQAIDRAKPIVSWGLDQIIDPLMGSPIEVRVQGLDEAAEIMTSVQNRVTWLHYANEIARRMDMPLPEVERTLRQRRNATREPARQKKRPIAQAQRSASEHAKRSPQQNQRRRTPPRPTDQTLNSRPSPPPPSAANDDARPQSPAPELAPAPTTPFVPGDPGPALDGPPPTWDAPPVDYEGPPLEQSDGPLNDVEPWGPEPAYEAQYDEADAADTPEVAAVMPIPRLEGYCLQLLTDAPSRLTEFMDEGCCQLLSDERLVNLLERVHTRHRETGQNPEFALAAEQLAADLGDQDFFDQISTLLVADRPYDDARMEQTYIDTLINLQRRWIEEEDKKIRRLMRDVVPGTEEASKVMERLREMNRIRAELDPRLQRKRS